MRRLVIAALLLAPPCYGGQRAYSAPLPAMRLTRNRQPLPKRGIKLANVIELNPELVAIKTVSARAATGKDAVTAAEAAAALPRAAALINSSFFDRGGSGRIIGLFIENGKPANYIKDRTMNRIFRVERNGSVAISTGTTLPPAIAARTRYALAGKSSWATTTDMTARSAVCITKRGSVKFITVYPVATSALMQQYLENDENCAQWLLLDGGGSTQTVFRPAKLMLGWERQPECYETPGAISPDDCFRGVAAFLTAEPKKP